MILAQNGYQRLEKQAMGQMAGKDGEENLRELVAQIVAAYVSKNTVAACDLPAIIRQVHASLGGLGGTGDGVAPRDPAVPIKKSVTPDAIICLEDGKKLKMLKRYLRARYQLTPEQYRARWNLPPDYPMVAPNYAARRSAFAKQIGLGKGGKSKDKRKKG